jgi:hypothetical protein
MEVLSLGVSRTGTSSMQEALDILGYANPYHFIQLITNAKDADLWHEAYKCKFQHKGQVNYRQQFDAVIGHCGAVTDHPAFVFWQELVDAYPDAKVVLVERDEDKWYTSVIGLVEGILNPFAVYFLRFADPYWYGRIENAGLWWLDAFFGSRSMKDIQKVARERYRRHYRDVRQAVPKDKLLEYELGSGWEPLCKFLGKPVPSVPFPHRNEATALEDAFVVLIQNAFKHAATNIAVVVVVGAVVGAAVRQYMM